MTRRSRSAVAPRALIAPDSFKGTFTSRQIAEHIAAGARDAGWTTTICPLADGGDGTLDVLATMPNMKDHIAVVRGALGQPVGARFILDETGLAVIEAAEAVGLAQIDVPTPTTAICASSEGVGELITEAVTAGANRILLAVGGTSTTDGGLGMFDILRSGISADVQLEVLCDSQAVYEDAAKIFGPQKGADAETVETLTRQLHAAAARLPRDPRGQAGTGCGGGMSGALWAFGAHLRSGADVILDLLGIDEELRGPDLVITGEGRLDPQTLTGKLIERLTARAQAHGRPLAVVAGSIDLGEYDIEDLGVVIAREAGTPDEITAAAQNICEEVGAWLTSS